MAIMPTIFIQTVGYFVLLTFVHVSATTVYITPTPNITCPNENMTCVNLTEYAQSAVTADPNSNITLIFEPKNHFLGLDLQVTNVAHLFLRVAHHVKKNVSHPVAFIKCNSSGFIFENISEVSISGFDFNGCEENIVRSVGKFRLQDCKFDSRHGIELDKIKNATIEKSLFTFLDGRLSENVKTKRNDIFKHAEAGGALIVRYCTVAINKCQFKHNKAQIGGSIYADNSDFKIYASNFANNEASVFGGVMLAHHGNITIKHSIIIANKAGWDAGAMEVVYVNLTIQNSTFNGNSAGITAGTIQARIYSVVVIRDSMFMNSKTTRGSGGVIHSQRRTAVVIHNSSFLNNSGNSRGGVIGGGYMYIRIYNSIFINNTAHADGGVIYIFQSSSLRPNCIHESKFFNNTAVNGGVLSVSYNNTITIKQCKFVDNMASDSGGVINSIGANVTIYNSAFTTNKAKYGGALAFQGNAEANNLLVRDCNFNNNTADLQGGAIRVHSTTLASNGSLQIINNRAVIGIVFAIDSTLSFSGNTIISSNYHVSQYLLTSIQSNIAFDGYTSILNNSLDTKTIQTTTIALSNIAIQPSDIVFRGTINLAYSSLYNNLKKNDFMKENETYIYIFTDSTIYIQTSQNTPIFSGGECAYQVALKFRSKANSTKLTNEIIDGGEGVYTVVTSDGLRLIRSKPIELCFCRNDRPVCSSPPPPIRVKRGQTFKLSLIALDRDNNVIPITVSALLFSRNGTLGEGQAIQSTSLICSNFEYSIFSTNSSEVLVLNPYGPCNNIEILQTRINVEFLPCSCPVGFVLNKQKLSSCDCVCDPDIDPERIVGCSLANESVQRKENKWISYINTSDLKSYLIHSHCPFDYCYPSAEQAWINLNILNGADAQCRYNRSGKLCGSCKEGLSLSLGNSNCMQCFNSWLALLIVFAIAGVALITFLLVCNLTVAVGTINGLVFYANIIAANRSIFIPLNNPNILTLFIAWLNFDFGFEACFYDGMDGYVKTWLQLAFPLYIISLVVAIIFISDYYGKFAALFRGKDPVATLATLILLSYTKLIHTIIASLSFTKITYLADGSNELVWLTDANVPYLKGKHVPLFMTAFIIFIVGLLYTILLFGWQWLVHPKIKPLTWLTKNSKIFMLMDTYHNPYNKDHRYWIGLLLLVRALLYLVSAVNVLGDPRINLLSINTAVVILFFVQIFPGYNITKRKLIFTLETVSLFNLIGFTIVTYYIVEDRQKQAVAANISTAIAFIMFLAILVYHTCEFVLKKQFDKFKSLFKKHCDRGPTIEVAPDATYNRTLKEVVSETVIDAPRNIPTNEDEWIESESESDDEVIPSNTLDKKSD